MMRNELYHYGVKGMRWGHRSRRTIVDLQSRYKSKPKKIDEHYDKEQRRRSEEYKARRNKAIKIGAAAVGTALATYGTYKMSKYIRDENIKIHLEKGKKVAENIHKSVYKDAFADANHVRNILDGHSILDPAISRGRVLSRDQQAEILGKAADRIETNGHKLGKKVEELAYRKGRRENLAKAAVNVAKYKARK